MTADPVAVRRVRLATRRRVLLGLGAAAAIGVGVVVNHALGHPVEHGTYWWWRARLTPPEDALRVVLLGDSSMIGVGAASPAQSLAGRAVALAEEISPRPVHAANLGVGGATVRDVVRYQLPRAQLERADLVLVSVGTGDVAAGVDLATFAADIGDLLDAVPPAMTVVSDVLMVDGYEPYQEELAAAADARHVRRALALEAFLAAGRRDVMALDGIHLSSLGYGIWFDAFREPIREILARD